MPETENSNLSQSGTKFQEILFKVSLLSPKPEIVSFQQSELNDVSFLSLVTSYSLISCSRSTTWFISF